LAFQRLVQVIDVGLVVPALVDLHRHLVDVRLQGVRGIRQRGQSVSHNILRGVRRRFHACKVNVCVSYPEATDPSVPCFRGALWRQNTIGSTAKAPIRSKKSTQLLRGRPKPLGVLEGRPYPPALTRPGRRLRGPGITGSASKVKLAPGS